MYGLVNKAIEDLITTEFGAEAWSEITELAGIDDIGFVSMDPYDDAVTYALVGAASQRLQMPAEQLLRAFGEYWMTYTAREGYGDLMDISGESFAEFLDNLDNLHARVGLSFPDLRPPSFRCEPGEDGKILLHYHSERDGLAPMIHGLVGGLARKFGHEVTIEHVVVRGEQSDHDVFEIEVCAT